MYERANCASCHSGPYYSDEKLYDVGTAQERDAGKPYVTTRLNELWRTAPYLGDGRAVTLEEVFIKYNPNDQHGKTSDLTPEELADLVEYLKSL